MGAAWCGKRPSHEKQDHSPGTMGPGRKSWMGQILGTDLESGQEGHIRRAAATTATSRVRQRSGGKGCEATWESRSGWGGRGEQGRTWEPRHKDEKPGPQGPGTWASGEAAGASARERGTWFRDSSAAAAKPICQRIGVVGTPTSRTTVKESRKKKKTRQRRVKEPPRQDQGRPRAVNARAAEKMTRGQRE